MTTTRWDRIVAVVREHRRFVITTHVHPDGDALVRVLAGEVEITVLAEAGPLHTTVRAGSVFIVPGGLWHRQLARQSVMQFGATVGQTEHSHAEDPRQRA